MEDTKISEKSINLIEFKYSQDINRFHIQSLPKASSIRFTGMSLYSIVDVPYRVSELCIYGKSRKNPEEYDKFISSGKFESYITLGRYLEGVSFSISDDDLFLEEDVVNVFIDYDGSIYLGKVGFYNDNVFDSLCLYSAFRIRALVSEIESHILSEIYRSIPFPKDRELIKITNLSADVVSNEIKINFNTKESGEKALWLSSPYVFRIIKTSGWRAHNQYIEFIRNSTV